MTLPTETGNGAREKIMNAFRTCYAANRIEPTLEELREWCHIHSRSEVHRHLNMLVREGKLVHNELRSSRGYRLSIPEKILLAARDHLEWWEGEGKGLSENTVVVPFALSLRAWMVARGLS